MAERDDSFHYQCLTTARFGRVTLLGALAGQGGAVQLYFTANDPQEAILPGAGFTLDDRRSVGDAPWLRGQRADATGPVALAIDGKTVEIDPVQADTALFEGLNVGLAIRNGEPIDAVLSWLAFHARTQGMKGAIIVNRAQPGSDPALAKALQQAAQKIEGLERLLLIEADIPLGQPDMPPEAHPLAAPDAPGKDRMEVPEADPWTAPFGQVLLYEYLRSRYLAHARAVMNIDMHDLIVPSKGPSVFDRAVAASKGVLTLVGEHVYPWRLREGAAPTFGDHICRQFDNQGRRRRWCVAPGVAPEAAVWRLIRIAGAEPARDEIAGFFRFMALRHGAGRVSHIVPKSALVEDAGLVALGQHYFDANPVRVPSEAEVTANPAARKTTIVTTMKNEGPFILEWLAYHRAIGVENFLIYTNDCTDGTDTMLQMLQEKGLVQHRENPFRGSGLKPQHAALQAADNEQMVQDSDWLICMDVDEFIAIHAGDGTLDALYDAIGDANMISLTWRLFGNSDIHEYRDEFITQAFTRCAPEMANKPHQAWGFKTLYRNLGIFKKMGVHRPKGLKPQLHEDIAWVNGSGKPLPQKMYRNAWRSTTDTVGYGLATLNHYAVRSAESFLVKRDRGRVNHVDRDQGLAYWFRMNNNFQQDLSIQRMMPRLREEYERLLADPDIRAAHDHSVACHRAKIDELRATENYSAFYAELTSDRMQRLSRLHPYFGANVFLSGPEMVPDEIVQRDPTQKFFFTIEKGETVH